MKSEGKEGLTINLSKSSSKVKNALRDFTYTQEDTRIHFTLKDPEKALPEIIKKIVDSGSHIASIEASKSSLEDVFLSLTGKGINE